MKFKLLLVSALCFFLAGMVCRGQSFSRVGFAGVPITNIIGAQQFGGPVAPVISGVTTNLLSSTTAGVIWTTDAATTNNAVDYGTTTGYGSTVTDNASGTSHSNYLSGLSASTTYHFRVRSSSAANGLSTTNSDGTFAPAGAPAYVPPSTNTLIHWWDYSDTGTVTATDSRIDSVTDKGTIPVTMQATTTLRPWNTNTVNGRQVATFVGAQRMATASALNLAYTDHWITVGVIAKAANGAIQIFVEGGTFANSGEFSVEKAADNKLVAALMFGGANYSLFTSTAAMDSATAYPLLLTWNGTLSSNESQGFISGNSAGTMTYNYNSTTAMASQTVYVGGRSSSAYYLTGDVYEVFIWTSLLDAQGISDFNAYKIGKYGN